MMPIEVRGTGAARGCLREMFCQLQWFRPEQTLIHDLEGTRYLWPKSHVADDIALDIDARRHPSESDSTHALVEAKYRSFRHDVPKPADAACQPREAKAVSDLLHLLDQAWLGGPSRTICSLPFDSTISDFLRAVKCRQKITVLAFWLILMKPPGPMMRSPEAADIDISHSVDFGKRQKRQIKAAAVGEIELTVGLVDDR